jgi:hypothetical protein
MMLPTHANKPNSYRLDSYRTATAPKPNPSRLTSLKSTSFDSRANAVGPWPARDEPRTRTHRSIPSSANARASFTPPTSSSLLDIALCQSLYAPTGQQEDPSPLDAICSRKMQATSMKSHVNREIQPHCLRFSA